MMEANDLFSLYSEYLAKLGRSPVTIRNYLSNLKLFSRWLSVTFETNRVDFTRVTEVDLLSYRNHLQYSKRHKTATINQHVAALRSFFSFLYNNGFISESVITSLKPLSKPFLRAPEVPKRADILKLFRMVDTSNDRGKRDFAILQLFIQCGLRLSEIASIELDDVEISTRKGVLRIVGGKGGQILETWLSNEAEKQCHLVDLVNEAIFHLKETSVELPAFRHLVRLVSLALHQADRKQSELLNQSIPAEQKEMLDALLKSECQYQRTPFYELKEPPENPSSTAIIKEIQ
jgi:site-specific recombinase XerC